MSKSGKGIKIAREILLAVTFCVTVANVVLMIVELALSARDAKGYYKIKDSDELPF